MNLPEPHQASKEEIMHTLNHLHGLLINLPKGLPTGFKYDMFKSFSLDPDLLDKTGDEVAAMHEQLKSVFGWSTRTTGDGILNISKWGTGIQAIQPILAEFFAKYLENAVTVLFSNWSLWCPTGTGKPYPHHQNALDWNITFLTPILTLLIFTFSLLKTNIHRLLITLVKNGWETMSFFTSVRYLATISHEALTQASGFMSFLPLWATGNMVTFHFPSPHHLFAIEHYLISPALSPSVISWKFD